MINLESQFSPRVNPADANYPFGSIKDNTSPGANDGTPLAAVWGNDWEGFAQAAMTEAGITPSGLPDTAQDSQLLDAVKVVASGALRPSVIEALRRSYAEAGYNVVGTFQAGFTYVNANDLGIDETTGKGYTGPVGPVAAGTNPTSGGFIDRSGELLRIQQLKYNGDIRGWGAVYDGVTPADVAISDAILETGGKILISGPTLVSSHVVFSGLMSPSIEFTGGGGIKILNTFTFSAGYRGIVVFDGCSNPSSINPKIVGARVDKLNAPEPWEDGDSGIEYMNCTGKCRTVRPDMSDFKAWGIIHVNVEDYEVTAPRIRNCLAQSGVGGTGVSSASVSDPDISNIGLYGVEIETTGVNKRSIVKGGVIRGCLKGVAAIGSARVDTDTVVEDCLTGFSGTNVNTKSGVFSGVARNCMTTMESNNTSDCTFRIIEKRDLVGSTAFYRQRSYDFILKMVGNTAYVLDRDGQRANMAVGNVLELEGGNVINVATVGTEVIDPVFGRLQPFTATPAMSASDSRKMFKRKVTLTGNMKYADIYDGDGLDINGGAMEKTSTAYVSFGNHNNMKIRNMAYRNVVNMFETGSAGSLTNCKVQLSEGDCNEISNFGTGVSKFVSAMATTRAFTLPLSGGHRLNVGICFLSKIEVLLDEDVTWGGTLILRVNGVDTVTSFTGTPKYGVSFLAGGVGINVNANVGVSVQLLSTGTSPTGSGYSVRAHGLFLK